MFPGSLGLGSAAASEITVSKATLRTRELAFGWAFLGDSFLAAVLGPLRSELPGTSGVSALGVSGQHRVSFSGKQKLL